VNVCNVDWLTHSLAEGRRPMCRMVKRISFVALVMAGVRYALAVSHMGKQYRYGRQSGLHIADELPRFTDREMPTVIERWKAELSA
jgi:hypothetical protein